MLPPQLAPCPGAPGESPARRTGPERRPPACARARGEPARGFLPARAPRPTRRDVIGPRRCADPRPPPRATPGGSLPTTARRGCPPLARRRGGAAGAGGGGGRGGGRGGMAGGGERRWRALETSSGPVWPGPPPHVRSTRGVPRGPPHGPRRGVGSVLTHRRHPGRPATGFGAARVGVWVRACVWWVGVRACVCGCLGVCGVRGGEGGGGPAAAWKGQGWGPDRERRGPAHACPRRDRLARPRFCERAGPGPSRANSVTAMCGVCREMASQSRAVASSSGHDRRTCRRACIRCP